MQRESSQFEPLICINRIDETAHVATFEFTKIDERLFAYKAGQFLTFEVDVAGELEYRAYSLSSTPSKPQTAAVAIKRVSGGKVSNYLLDNLQPGLSLAVTAPAGEFTLEDKQKTAELLLMSAGSSITPCISMARWLLDTQQQQQQQQQVNIHFIYTARSEVAVIMADTLNSLNEQNLGGLIWTCFIKKVLCLSRQTVRSLHQRLNIRLLYRNTVKTLWLTPNKPYLMY